MLLIETSKRLIATLPAACLTLIMLYCATTNASEHAMTQFYSNEADLESHYVDTIQPWWQSDVVQDQLSASDGLKLHYTYVLHPQSIGDIVISSGRIESLIKYKEFMYELYQQGYSVYIIDHRGQGLSERMNDFPQRGFVEDFDDYVNDFEQFYTEVVKVNSRHQPILICHSMGSAIGALYLLKNPHHFAKVVFSSPMFGIKAPLPQWLADVLISTGIRINSVLSVKPWYFIGQTDYLPVPFALNTISNSKIRYQLFRQEYDAQPKVKLGGVTFKWLRAAIAGMNRIEEHARDIQIPVLMLQAGNELVVDNEAQDRVCDKFPHCIKHRIENAKHELFMESDEFRQPVMSYLQAFLQAD